MKRWLVLLAFSLVFSGCNNDKQEQKAKTQATRQKDARPAKTAAIQNLGSNRADVVLFLNRAEHVFEELYYAAATMPNGRTVYEDGVAYRRLPARFNTKEKILDFFGRYWSRPLAENMYDNLRTKLVRGNVYLARPETDYPLLISVRNTTAQKNDTGLLATVTEVTIPAYAKDRTIRYQLVRDAKTRQFEIRSRTGAYGSEMFE